MWDQNRIHSCRRRRGLQWKELRTFRKTQNGLNSRLFSFPLKFNKSLQSLYIHSCCNYYKKEKLPKTAKISWIRSTSEVRYQSQKGDGQPIIIYYPSHKKLFQNMFFLISSFILKTAIAPWLVYLLRNSRTSFWKRDVLSRKYFSRIESCLSVGWARKLTRLFHPPLVFMLHASKH